MGARVTPLDRLDQLEREATPQIPNRWKWELDRGNYRIRVLAPAGVWVEIPYDQADAELICLSRNHLRALIEVAKAADEATLAYGNKDGPLLFEMEKLGRLVAPLLAEKEEASAVSAKNKAAHARRKEQTGS